MAPNQCCGCLDLMTRQHKHTDASGHQDDASGGGQKELKLDQEKIFIKHSLLVCRLRSNEGRRAWQKGAKKADFPFLCAKICTTALCSLWCQGIYTCKAKPSNYQPVKSNHPGSQNIRHSGLFKSPAVTTIGHWEKSKTLPSTKDKSHGGDAFHYVVI